jgi:uncharacterized protein with HEPN domain
MPSDRLEEGLDADARESNERRAGPLDRRTAGYARRQEKLRFRDWRFRVRDILAALSAIAEYTDGMTFEEFAADQRTLDAVIRNLVTMGESIRWIPEPILSAHPDVPWWTMRGVRNVVVHEYFGVDDVILWTTVQHDLPPLVPRLEAVLRA